MRNFDVQRKNMVDNQVRPGDVTDRRIVRAMLEIPRELFVPEELQPLAYSDQELRISSGNQPGQPRYLAPPGLFAKMVQGLELGDSDIVLHIGCGTGYGSAVLSQIARKVVALEDDPDLVDRARKALAGAQIKNVQVVKGELVQGYDHEAPYDAILLEGSVAEVPPHLLDQLKDGGRLIAVRSNGNVGKVMRWRRDGLHFGEQPQFDATLPPLPGFERKPQFIF